MKNNILIFDGTYFLVKYSSSKQQILYNSDGLDIYPLFKIMKLLSDSIIKYQPKEVYLIIDIGRDIKKKQKLKEYKEKRIPINKNINSYLNVNEYQKLSLTRYILLNELNDVIPIKFITIPLVEGDAIVYYVADKLKQQEGNNIIIFTGDKDLLQACDTNISVSLSVNNPKKHESYYELLSIENYRYIWSKFSILIPNDHFFHPSNIPYYRALIGDTSDGIKGIKNIGIKTVNKLINVAIKNDIQKFNDPSEFIEFYKNVSVKENDVKKAIEILLDNIDTWKTIFEIIDLKHTIEREISGPKIHQIENSISKPINFNIPKIMEIFHKYDLNSTDNYKEWLLSFEALYKNDYTIFENTIKGYQNFISSLNNFLHKINSQINY